MGVQEKLRHDGTIEKYKARLMAKVIESAIDPN